MIGTPSARSKIIRPRRARPAGVAVARCHARSVCRSAGVRRIVREVVRPRAIRRPSVRGGRWEHNLHAVASGEARALRVHHIRTSAVPESIRVRCQCWGLQCGSVRIGSAVCGSLREVVCVSGILDLRGARIKRKFGTPIQASDRYNTRQQRYEQLSRAGKRDNTSAGIYEGGGLER